MRGEAAPPVGLSDTHKYSFERMNTPCRAPGVAAARAAVPVTGVLPVVRLGPVAVPTPDGVALVSPVRGPVPGLVVSPLPTPCTPGAVTGRAAGGGAGGAPGGGVRLVGFGTPAALRSM